ncbi:MAG TPA: pentapeptide repeat-containing protein [Ardenticatenaceae bacterium]|nr:pentapeptide repeat-containing protein [Ardenticatenaceae bacterium]
MLKPLIVTFPYLSGANLHRATLDLLDLRGADLSTANLIQAHLYHADLRGANLRSADLSGADLSHANVTGATYNSATRWPEGFVPSRGGAIHAN